MRLHDASGQKPSRSWLDLPPSTTARWDDAIFDAHLVAHLNIKGEAEIVPAAAEPIHVLPGTLTWLRGHPAQIQRAVRMPRREKHHCLTLYFPISWLREITATVNDSIPSPFDTVLAEPLSELFTHQRPITPQDIAWAEGLMPEHLCVQARELLDTVRLTEFLLKEFFGDLNGSEEKPTPISRTERLSKERVEQTKALLLEQLDEPPSLDDLARLLSCNPQHLSRTFSKIEGLPLSLWLRRQRINRAAELIATGQFNVSEAAIEVGYRSFSHFSSAFLQEKGIQPSKWVGHIKR